MDRHVARADGVQRIDHGLAEAEAFRDRHDLHAELGQPLGVGGGDVETLGQHEMDRPLAERGELQLVEPLDADRQEGRGQGGRTRRPAPGRPRRPT
ncbi:hypothetical protein [Phenylobacterium sp. J367]|uniref:hypothetical protein n=1 Tax=Phenylobacterium sp. J367 TaxID=2898435 RepID=UPI002151E04A|nr:hypothetical protein [Phenylobacterium sp. J367]MCR5879220.1 hypothetical protein [Phenylobacterium sp. J367]